MNQARHLRLELADSGAEVVGFARLGAALLRRQAPQRAIAPRLAGSVLARSEFVGLPLPSVPQRSPAFPCDHSRVLFILRRCSLSVSSRRRRRACRAIWGHSRAPVRCAPTAQPCEASARSIASFAQPPRRSLFHSHVLRISSAARRTFAFTANSPLNRVPSPRTCTAIVSPARIASSTFVPGTSMDTVGRATL